MAVAGTKITGAKELIRNLEKLGIDVSDLKVAFTDIARRSADIAASLAPKRTGRLAKSIRGSKTKNRATVAAGSKRVPYAGPVAFGWPARNIKPQNFMWAASARMGPIAEQEIRAELERLLAERHLS